MKTTTAEIPDAFHADIRRATEILRAAGCSEIFLFGSLAEKRASASSDLDLAVRGCPPGSFFRVFGKLMMELDHPVDLVDMDSQDPFARYLAEHEELVQVG
jgi:predicted nucleotidyltransferase